MIRLPNNSQRIAIVGRTGSGKTQAAVWHLSKRNLDRFPWVVFDLKGDDLINSIERAEHIDVGYVPKRNATGIFICHPRVGEDDAVTAYLWKLWERENIGVYCDEGYMIGASNNAYNSCLTQGRSKRIPMITLSQRPVWLSRFVWSESDFYQIFDLGLDDDKDTAMGYMNGRVDLYRELPDYYSYYYDVVKKAPSILAPVPNEDVILGTIDEKLKTPGRKKI